MRSSTMGLVGERFRDTHELPDGYRWDGYGPAIVLIDPEWCPANVHPFVMASRDGVTRCTNREHTARHMDLHLR